MTAHSERILLCMGDARQRRTLSGWLHDAQYTVEQTSEFESAYTLTGENVYSALVVDQDVEGDVLALCRDLGGVLPVLLIGKDARLIDDALAAGALDVLTPPLTPVIVQRRLANVIALDEHQRRWQQTFHQNHAAKLLVDPATERVIDANVAACRLYEYTHEQILSLTISDLDAGTAAPPSLRSSSASNLFNFRHRTSSGELRDVKLFANPVIYHGQRALYMVITDITKRRQAEAAEADQRTLAEALRATASAITSTLELNEVLDRILEQVNNVVPSYSANIMLIEAGEARVVRARGYHPTIIDRVARFSLPIAETPSLRWMIDHRRALVIPQLETSDLWTSTPGLFDWMTSYVGAPIRIGNYVIGFLNLDNDGVRRFDQRDADYLQAFADQAAIAIRNARLYERVQRQALELEHHVQERTFELESERSQLRAIIDAMTEGVAYVEMRGEQLVTQYINRAMEQITGYTAQEWMEYSFALLRPDDRDTNDYGRILLNAYDDLQSGHLFRHEDVMRRKNGSQFSAVLTATGVFSPEGLLQGAVGVLRDVTQEKALEAQKAHFVAHASHELRTPITNLKTRLYLLRKQPERIEEHLRVLEHVTDRMKWLVDDLLNYSRLERGAVRLDFQPVLLQEMLTDIVAVQLPEAERKEQQLTCEVPETPVYVRADPQRLAQVITNLVSNAINYTPAHGMIIVRLVSIVQRAGEYARVEVEDNGIGIAPEHLTQIFEPFYRVVSQVEGTGLGLSIARSIIEAHGGVITVTSVLGVGSTFRFRLPMIAIETEPSSPS